MIFTYAFVQKDQKVYSYLIRKNGTIDQLLFGDKPSLEIHYPDFWEKWKQEASYVDNLDSADFLFLVPKASTISMTMTSCSFGTVWTQQFIDRFLKNAIGEKYISGNSSSSFAIDGMPYSIIIYKSNNLPSFHTTQSDCSSLKEMKELISHGRIVITLDALREMSKSEWFSKYYYYLLQTGKKIGIAVAEINSIVHLETDSDCYSNLLSKYHSIIVKYGNPDDVDIKTSLLEAVEKYSGQSKLSFIVNQNDIANSLWNQSRALNKVVQLYFIKNGVLSQWDMSN